MLECFLSDSAKGAIFSAVYDAEENYLYEVRQSRNAPATTAEMYYKGMYIALYGLMCRLSLKPQYQDWVSGVIEDDEEDEEEE